MPGAVALVSVIGPRVAWIEPVATSAPFGQPVSLLAAAIFALLQVGKSFPSETRP